MSRTTTDLLLGQVGDRALDGATLAVPLVAAMSPAAWSLFVTLLPLTDPRTGAVALTGAALAIWLAATPAARGSMLSPGVVIATPGGLVFNVGITNVGGPFARTPLAWSFSAATPDGAALYTASTVVIVYSLLWLVSTAFTGGTAPTLAVRSTNAASNTPGDLLGGPSGDGASVLGVLGPVVGTPGPKLVPPAVATLAPGDTIVLNRLASAFTSGSGQVLAMLSLIT